MYYMVKKKEEPISFELTEIEGVGPTKMKRMNTAGLKYVHDICMSSVMDISRITGLDNGKAETLWLNSSETLERSKTIRPKNMSALESYKYKMELETLPSKCEAIDILFGGKGPKCETFTEVYGGFGSGKTQYIMCCMVEIMNKGHKVFMIDCEDTLDVERLVGIARARGYIKDDSEIPTFLEKLILKTASNSTEMYHHLNNSTEKMLNNDIKLFVVDGAIGQIRQEYLGRGELSVRQDYLKPLMGRLSALPMYFNCWVIMSNQIQHDPGAMFVDPTKPIGGNIVGHAATFRVMFKNYSDTKWSAKMVDSPHHARLTMPFKLTNSGVVDIPDELRKSKKVLCNIEAKSFIENNLDKSDEELLPLINELKKIQFYNIDYNINILEVKKLRKEAQPKNYKANEGPVVDTNDFSEEGLKNTELLLDNDKEFTLSN